MNKICLCKKDFIFDSDLGQNNYGCCLFHKGSFNKYIIMKDINERVSELENEKNECIRELNVMLEDGNFTPTIEVDGFDDLDAFKELYHKKVSFLNDAIERVKKLSTEDELFKFNKECFIYNELWDREYCRNFDAFDKDKEYFDISEEDEGFSPMCIVLLGSDECVRNITDDQYRQILYEDSAEGEAAFEQEYREKLKAWNITEEEFESYCLTDETSLEEIQALINSRKEKI